MSTELENNNEPIEVTTEGTPQEVNEDDAPEETDVKETTDEPESDTQDDDSDDDDAQEVTEETENEDDSETNDKRDTKAEKRIQSLSGKLKESTEVIKKLDSENQELREEINAARADINAEVEKQSKNTEHFSMLVHNNVPISVVETDEEFEKLLDMAADNPNVTAQAIRDAQKKRQSYLKSIQPAIEKELELSQQSGELWNKEWGNIQTNLIEGLDKETAATVVNTLVDELNKDVKDPITFSRLQRSARAKQKWVIGALEKLGLDKQLEDQAYKKNRPSLGAPAASGKGRKSPPAGKKKPVFTREQLSKMSQAEFNKNEAAIDKAMAEGRIR